MEDTAVCPIGDDFATLQDPRVDRTKQHPLLDIMVIAVCAVICGADRWVEIEAFGKAKCAWVRTFLSLPNGLPAHAPFGRVFAARAPKQFQPCCLDWVPAMATSTDAQIVARAGKTLRRSHDRTKGKAAMHLVRAWASANRLVLGQVKVDEQSNEMTALPALLQGLALTGGSVPIAAMGGQTAIAKTMVAPAAEDVVARKGKQGTFHREGPELLAQAQATNFRDIAHDFHATVHGGQGRIAGRRQWTLTEAAYIRDPDPDGAWAGRPSSGMVEPARHVGTMIPRETRYYIAS